MRIAAALGSRMRRIFRNFSDRCLFVNFGEEEDVYTEAESTWPQPRPFFVRPESNNILEKGTTTIFSRASGN